MSAPSRKEQVTGTPIILCGFMPMESARWLPESLCACVEENMTGPPHEASMCSHMLCDLQMVARDSMGS